MTIRHLAPPFRRYHRANLERLVQEGFDRLEVAAIRELNDSGYYTPDAPMSAFDFQVLMAADRYLQRTA